MPRVSQLIMTVCAATASSLVYAACPYPEEVQIPDGSTATTEEMVSGQTQIKQFMAEMEAYLSCLDREEADLDREPTTEELTMHNQRHNAAVDTMESVAAEFNDQVRAYKKKNR